MRENDRRVQTEIDFVCNRGGSRCYVQSALNLSTPEKTFQESRPLNHTGDSFKKIIVVKDHIRPWHTEDGILDFLLDPVSLEN